MAMIKVMLLSPNAERGGLTAQEVEVNSENLEALQSLVGGLIERIPFGTYEFWCNEEGRVLGMPVNKFLGVEIAGAFFITRKNMRSLDESDLLMFSMQQLREDRVSDHRANGSGMIWHSLVHSTKD